MKAVVVTATGGPEVLSYQDVPDPTPGPDHVLIRVEATGVNYADILMRMGKYHSAGRPPLIPGLDAAGTVVRLGPGVTGLRVGQRVATLCGTGGYAELVVTPAAVTWPVPDEVDPETAAA